MAVRLADRSSLFHRSPRYPVRPGDASEHMKVLLGSIGGFLGGNRRPWSRAIPFASLRLSGALFFHRKDAKAQRISCRYPAPRDPCDSDSDPAAAKTSCFTTETRRARRFHGGIRVLRASSC